MRMAAMALAAMVLSACSPENEGGKQGAGTAPAGATTTLESLMPPAPSGWKLEGAPAGEVVPGAGKRATATWVPADDAARKTKITRIELHYAVLAPGASEGQFKTLRKHPAAGAMFLSQGSLAGKTASESLGFMSGRHLVSFRPSKSVIVDLLVFAGEEETWDAPRQAVASALVERIDFGKIECVK